MRKPQVPTTTHLLKKNPFNTIINLLIKFFKPYDKNNIGKENQHPSKHRIWTSLYTYIVQSHKRSITFYALDHKNITLFMILKRFPCFFLFFHLIVNTMYIVDYIFVFPFNPNDSEEEKI